MSVLSIGHSIKYNKSIESGVNNMREWAMETIIKELGHEHPMTIWFIKVCEENPNADDEKFPDLLNAALDLVRFANEIEE